MRENLFVDDCNPNFQFTAYLICNKELIDVSPFSQSIPSNLQLMEQAMMHGYFKMGNVSCRIVSDTTLFTCKIHVLAMSMACPCRIHIVSRHHREQAL